MAKRIVTLVMLLACMESANGWFAYSADTVQTYWDNGQLKEFYPRLFYEGSGWYTKEGCYRSWHANGQLEQEGFYYRDIKIGTWVMFDSLGYRVTESNYSNGKLNGLAIKWHSNGTIRELLNYRDGKLHGRCFERNGGNDPNHHEDMFQRNIRFFLNDTLIVTLEDPLDPKNPYGQHNLFYSESTKLWYECDWMLEELYIGPMADIMRHGKWTRYDSAGDVIDVDFYFHGIVIDSL